MSKKVLLLALVSASLLLNGCVTTQSVGVRTHSPGVSTSFYFSDSDRSRIRGYYLYNRPYNRQGPPGHRKQYSHRYQRHQVLPNGVPYSRLPSHLESRLPRLPADYIRIVVGGDVMIMNVRTRVIYDVFLGLE
jgi:hypothetical protein